MKKLSGQIAVISGGLGDIGRAIATVLAEQGADIALCDLAPPAAAEPFLAELRAQRVRAAYGQCDVADSGATAAWIAEVETALGVPTLIVPNAAQVTRVMIRDLTPEQWDRELRVNLGGAFNLAQSVARRLLVHQRPGRIVFIGSWAAHRSHPGLCAYAVGKAALRMLCQCMAVEFAPHDILVNEVAPGYVDAGLSGQVFKRDPALRESLRQVVPIQRLVEPRDVALAVAYLCDPENRHMTGATVLQDGGLSLKPPQP